MFARKLRSALTAIAVLLGVSMISGTYVLTDQIRDSFEGILETGNEGTDAVLSPATEFSSSYSQDERLPASLVDRVRRVPSVESAAGQSEAFGALVVDGEEIRTPGAHSLVFGHSPEPFDPTEPTDGRDPASSGEIAVSRDLADDHGIEVGDRVQLETSVGVQDVTVVGLVSFGGEGSAAGYGFTVATPGDIARWYEQDGEVASISVAAANGVTPEELVMRLKGVLAPGVKVETGQENASEEARDISNSINSFLGPSLLVFAGAALLVGAFIIFNTFSISVAERTRELAALRTLGATRGQVLGLIAVEALAIGVTASVIGLFGGLAFAKLIGALFDAGGFPIPTGGLILKARTIEIALGIGIGVTLIAAVGPAMRATRVAPALALEEGARLPSTRTSRLAPYLAALVTAGGLVLFLVGLFGSGPATTRLLNIAIGAVLLFVGMALVAKYVVRPVAAALGMPLERLFPVLGRLARENAQRNPARTALTAAALMVGLGMVVFVAVFTAGLKASVNDSIDRLINAEVVVTSGGGFEPIPDRTREIAAQVPGVADASAVYYDQIEVDGRKSNVLYDALGGIDPKRIRSGYSFEWIDGSDALLDRLRGRNAVVEEQFADARDIVVGDEFEVVTPSGGRTTLTAIGEYRDPQLLNGVLVDRTTLDGLSAARDPYLVLVSTRPDAETEEVRAAIETALQRFPVAEVEDQAGLREQVSDQTNQIVYLLYALLAMSVLISLFGIANSLFLSIHERTREFGLLRAVGTTRRQIRRMVRYESAITGGIGGLLGTVIGILFGVLITESLDNLGLQLEIPVGQLVIFMVLAVAVGIAGAVLPARRGARIDVLEAVHYE
jgi:putative ABC transport system permease protein